MAVASRSMAAAAIENIVDEKQREKAEKELAKADKAFEKGDYDKAVDQFGKALERATK